MSDTVKTPDQVIVPELVENDNSLFAGATLKLAVKEMETEIRSLVLDPSDPQQYKYFGTVNRKISGMKAEIERRGKGLVDPIKAQCKEIDALRNMVKTRLGALGKEFMQPRVDHDEAIAAKAKKLADAFDMITNGNARVGEFKTRAEVSDWDSRVNELEQFEVKEDLFGERATEASEALTMALTMAKHLRDKCVEEEKALEAGRVALKAQEDAEAAARHEARQKEKAASIAPAPATKPMTATALNDSESAERERKGVVHRQIVTQLKKSSGVSEETAQSIVRDIYHGRIQGLQIVY